MMPSSVGDGGYEKTIKQPHAKQIMPYHLSPRCGAKTRSGMPCKSPAVKGKKRCRMHGGAKGSGAPKGNKNAFVHGIYSNEFREAKKHLSGFLHVCFSAFE
jgi:hypothetical protein